MIALRPARRGTSALIALVALLTSTAFSEAGPAATDPHCADREVRAHKPSGDDTGAQAPLRPCVYRTGRRSMEPSLAFAPTGKLLFQAWELSSDGPGGVPPQPVLLRHDGGDLWSEASPRPLPHPVSLDPYLYADPRTGRIFTLDWIAGANPWCSTISHSDDGAQTWVTSPLACGGFDGESIAAGPPVSSPTIGYPNIVYYCTGASLGTGEPITTPSCSKSLDGGLTFTPTGGYPYDATGAQDVFPGWAGNPVVDGHGTLYLPKRHEGDPWVAISRDEGFTWEQVRVAPNGAAGAATRMALVNDGSLVYTWTGNDHLPYIARSIDGGTTWTAPLMIAPPEVEEAALPRVVAGPDGAVAVAYVGTENAPGGPPYYDFCNVHLGDCTDGRYTGVEWDGYVALIRHPADADPLIRTAAAGGPGAPLLIGGCSADGGCKAVLDFVDVQFDSSGAPWAAFVDDCAVERDFVPLFSAGLPRCGDGVGEGIVVTIAGASSL